MKCVCEIRLGVGGNITNEWYVMAKSKARLPHEIINENPNSQLTLYASVFFLLGIRILLIFDWYLTYFDVKQAICECIM